MFKCTDVKNDGNGEYSKKEATDIDVRVTRAALRIRLAVGNLANIFCAVLPLNSEFIGKYLAQAVAHLSTLEKSYIYFVCYIG